MIAAKKPTRKKQTATADDPAAVALQKLWRAFKRAPHRNDLRDALIERYLPLVKYQARLIWNRLPDGVEIEDLESAGVFGLVAAIRRFDLKRELRFETYAPLPIRGAILDELRNMDWVPRTIRSQANKIAATMAELSALLGRDPDAADVAKYLDLSIEEFEELKFATRAVGLQSLYRPCGVDDDGTEIYLCEIVDDPRAELPTISSQSRDLMRLVTKGLNKAERLIVIGYYYEELTMKQIAESLALSESRVSQMHSIIIQRLRGLLARRREEFVV